MPISPNPISFNINSWHTSFINRWYRLPVYRTDFCSYSRQFMKAFLLCLFKLGLPVALLTVLVIGTPLFWIATNFTSILFVDDLVAPFFDISIFLGLAHLIANAVYFVILYIAFALLVFGTFLGCINSSVSIWKKIKEYFPKASSYAVEKTGVDKVLNKALNKLEESNPAKLYLAWKEKYCPMVEFNYDENDKQKASRSNRFSSK